MICVTENVTNLCPILYDSIFEVLCIFEEWNKIASLRLCSER